MQVDKPLLMLVILLAVVMVVFLLGRIPWPFGILVIVILMVARVSYLQSRKSNNRD